MATRAADQFSVQQSGQDVTQLYGAPTRRADLPLVHQNPGEALWQRREGFALPHRHDLHIGAPSTLCARW
jgi:hypothetical protein